MREGIGKGKLVQTIYWSPQGKKITSKKELFKELGQEYQSHNAPECFDFKTGTYSLELLKKKKEREARKNECFIRTGHLPIEYNFDMPSRRATWCGEMPLKVIRHYPGNKVEKKYPAGKEREKDEGTRPIPPVRQRPTQLLSEKRLENMRPRDQDGFITSEMKLPELIDPVMEEIYDDGPLLSRMSAQLLSSDAPLQGQKDIDTKDLARSEGLKDGEKDLHKLLVLSDHVQPLCKFSEITDKEILQQEDTVRKAQNALAEMMAKYREQQAALAS